MERTVLKRGPVSIGCDLCSHAFNPNSRRPSHVNTFGGTRPHFRLANRGVNSTLNRCILAYPSIRKKRLRTLRSDRLLVLRSIVHGGRDRRTEGPRNPGAERTRRRAATRPRCGRGTRKYFGDKGLMKAALGKIGDDPEGRRRRRTARRSTASRRRSTAAYETALADAKEKALQASLDAEPARRDAARPAAAAAAGCTSPRRSCAQIYAIFADLGFQVYRSREVEDDETNFELLNMPPHHPARDMWDTFHTTTPGVAAAHAHVAGPDPRDARAVPASRSA